jgi:uncharacterized protein YjcR
MAQAQRIAGGGAMIEIDKQQFESLYYQGYNPSEIAERLGLSRECVYGWMYIRGYRAICPEFQKIAHEMYYSGATDLETAMATNSNVSAIAQWREKNKLPRGQTRGRKRQRNGLPKVV